MTRYFAFLRGINVGGHRIKMDRLRELVEAMGFGQVETFIASGNVIFSSQSADVGDMEARIALQLEQELGYAVPTFIRTQRELDAIAAFEPSEPPAPDPSVYVIFFPEVVGAGVRQSFKALSTDKDEFEFAGREVFWLIDGKLSESPLFGVDLTKMAEGAQTTMRSMTTLRRLAARYTDSG